MNKLLIKVPIYRSNLYLHTFSRKLFAHFGKLTRHINLIIEPDTNLILKIIEHVSEGKNFRQNDNKLKGKKNNRKEMRQKVKEKLQEQKRKICAI